MISNPVNEIYFSKEHFEIRSFAFDNNMLDSTYKVKFFHLINIICYKFRLIETQNKYRKEKKQKRNSSIFSLTCMCQCAGCGQKVALRYTNKIVNKIDLWLIIP